LSLLSVGGGNGVIPDMQRASVTVNHWMTDREFLDLFAISRAGPGPGSLLVILIGQKAAGLPGALVAGVAMYLPSCLIVYGATRLWRHGGDTKWRRTVEKALAPIAVGLMFGAGFALMQSAETGWLAYSLTAAATVLLAFTRINPLLVLLGGGGAAILALYLPFA
jgi:chromate transporter